MKKIRKFTRKIFKILKYVIVIIFIAILTCQYLNQRGNINSQGELNGPYNVVRVVDGDTIIVNINNNEERVRMIGIDTPESVHSDSSKNTEEGKLASNFTTALLTDQKVYLEYDKTSRDKYNRLLAYIYIKNGNEYLFVNNYIILSGYAYPMTVEPNNKYADLFLKSFEQARENKNGLWED